MSEELIRAWNNDPPPTAAFLEKLAAWRQVERNFHEEPQARRDLIESISTAQDLAQFLLERSGTVRHDPTIENETVDRYWDALAGVISVDHDRAAPNSWSRLAFILDTALYYE